MDGSDVPAVTADQMRQVDRAAVAEYGLTVAQLMADAGYQVAAFVRAHTDAGTVHVYAGAGNNGGDGLVAARRLAAWGRDVTVVLAEPDLDGLPADHRAALDAVDVPVRGPDADLPAPDVIVDALLGYGLEGAPRPPYDALIEQIAAADARVVAVDVPSGVDATTGAAREPHVTADDTVTLALPTTGLAETPATGRLWLADIGIPPEAYDRCDVDARGLFADASLVRIDRAT